MIGALIAVTMVGAASRSAPGLRQKCEAFKPAKLPNGAVVTGIRYAADSGGVAERCIVRARIVSSPTSTINMRIDLPAPGSWNGRTLTMGGGGFDGLVPSESYGWRSQALLVGLPNAAADSFVVGSTDSGHQGRGERPYMDYSWAAHNPTALQNHASEANHLTLGVMVALAKAFYGKTPTRRYMFGGSNGARQGLIAAQRHPEDYDGIIALAPAISQTAFAANLTPIFRHIYQSPDNWLDQKKISLYVAAEVAACDEQDGIKDGIIGNYRACKFDPGTIACKGSDDGKCLTKGQVETIRMWMGEKRVNAPMANDMTGYAVYGPGGPVEEWAFVFGQSFPNRDAPDFILADNIVKATITDNPNASVMTHEPEKFPKQYFANSELIDATNPDLSAFSAHGGKIISVHGAGDYCVSYERMGQYYHAVEAKAGKENTRAFFRYYVAPSIGHGFSGAGPNSFDLFGAIRAWVENGKSPDQPIASKRDPSGAVKLTRPLCEYGTYPRYRGSGDPNRAESFACAPN